MRAAVVALVLTACAAAPLRRHAATLGGSARDEVAAALEVLDDLRARGLTSGDRLGRECESHAVVERGPGEVVGVLTSSPVTPACRDARASLELVAETRWRLEENVRGHAGLEALDAAARELWPVEHECPTRGSSALAAVANAVRAQFSFDPEPQAYIGLAGATEVCRVPSVYGAIEIGPPRDTGGYRAESYPGRTRTREIPAPGSYDFEDDLLEIPPGPFEGLPVLVVALHACNFYHFVLALDGDRWHVVSHLRGSC